MQPLGTNNDTATTLWRLDTWSSSSSYKGAWGFDASTRNHHDDGQGKFVHYGNAGCCPVNQAGTCDKVQLEWESRIGCDIVRQFLLGNCNGHYKNMHAVMWQKYKGVVQTGQLLTKNMVLRKDCLKG